MMAENRLQMLAEVVQGVDEILIIPHNDPDPDAIASAVALRYLLGEWLGVSSIIRYQGIIGRAENKALVRTLDNPLQRLGRNDLRSTVPIALVDTQQGTGNNPLRARQQATIIIDHHVWREASRMSPFVDVRPGVGATATILLEYLQGAGIELPTTLATALFYGIKTDTMGLSRGATSDDRAAYLFLQSRIDVQAIVAIEQAQVSSDYFMAFDSALHAARLYRDVLTVYMGPTKYPDMAAEMADILLRLEGVRWVLCMAVYNQSLILSVRTRDPAGGAGALVQQIVRDRGTAGGHGTLAGGQVPLQDRNPGALANELTGLALQQLKVRPGTLGRLVIPKHMNEIDD